MAANSAPTAASRAFSACVARSIRRRWNSPIRSLKLRYAASSNVHGVTVASNSSVTADHSVTSASSAARQSAIACLIDARAASSRPRTRSARRPACGTPVLSLSGMLGYDATIHWSANRCCASGFAASAWRTARDASRLFASNCLRCRVISGPSRAHASWPAPSPIGAAPSCPPASPRAAAACVAATCAFMNSRYICCTRSPYSRSNGVCLRPYPAIACRTPARAASGTGRSNATCSTSAKTLDDIIARP